MAENSLGDWGETTHLKVDFDHALNPNSTLDNLCVMET